MAWGIVKRIANGFTRRYKAKRKSESDQRRLNLRGGGRPGTVWGTYRESLLGADCWLDEAKAEDAWAAEANKWLRRLSRMVEEILFRYSPKRTWNLALSIQTFNIAHIFTITGASAYYAPFVERYHNALYQAFELTYLRMEYGTFQVRITEICGEAIATRTVRFPVNHIFEIRVENLHHIWIELLEPAAGVTNPVRQLPLPISSIGKGDSIGFRGPAYRDASGRWRWGREDWDVVDYYEDAFGPEGWRFGDAGGGYAGGDDYEPYYPSYEGTDGPYPSDDGGGGGGGGDSSDDDRLAIR